MHLLLILLWTFPKEVFLITILYEIIGFVVGVCVYECLCVWNDK